MTNTDLPDWTETARSHKDVPMQDRWQWPQLAMTAGCTIMFAAVYLFNDALMARMILLMPCAALCAYADWRWGIVPDLYALSAIAVSLIVALSVGLLIALCALGATLLGATLFWWQHNAKRVQAGGGDVLLMGFIFGASVVVASSTSIFDLGIIFGALWSVINTVTLGSAIAIAATRLFAFLLKEPRRRQLPVGHYFGLALFCAPVIPYHAIFFGY